MNDSQYNPNQSPKPEAPRVLVERVRILGLSDTLIDISYESIPTDQTVREHYQPSHPSHPAVPAAAEQMTQTFVEQPRHLVNSQPDAGNTAELQPQAWVEAIGATQSQDDNMHTPRQSTRGSALTGEIIDTDQYRMEQDARLNTQAAYRMGQEANYNTDADQFTVAA